MEGENEEGGRGYEGESEVLARGKKRRKEIKGR